jgi:hypothetical protein
MSELFAAGKFNFQPKPIIAGARYHNLHLTRDRGGLAINGEVTVERAQHCFVLIIKLHLRVSLASLCVLLSELG